MKKYNIVSFSALRSVETHLKDMGHNVFLVSPDCNFVRTVKDCGVYPDIVFLKRETVTCLQLEQWKKSFPECKIVMHYGDQRSYPPQRITSIANFLDILFVTNADQSVFNTYIKCGVKNVCTLHQGFNTNEFFRINCPCEYDVMFGGSNYLSSRRIRFPLSKYRFSLISNVRNRYRMFVCGSGWPFSCKTSTSYHNKSLYNEYINNASINIGVNHYNTSQYYNRRLFECAGTGRLHITKYIPGMEKDFGKNHEYLAWFNTEAECVNLIAYFLHEKEHRYDIETRALKFFSEYHTYLNRAKEFLNIIERIL